MPHPDKDIQAAIDEARRIVREDKLVASHREIRDRFDKHFPPETPEDPNVPPAPDKKDPPPDPPKRKGVWWPDDNS